MQQLQLDEFLRSLKQNIDMPHSLLLGAGASIESGVQSATECIWYWKKEIYLRTLARLGIIAIQSWRLSDK